MGLAHIERRDAAVAGHFAVVGVSAANGGGQRMAKAKRVKCGSPILSSTSWSSTNRRLATSIVRSWLDYTDARPTF